jgi:RNA:NAD 2'-phosphotransferase (TPT1/KptA family)
MIVYHGTTPDTIEGIQREGLVAGSHVTPHRSLAAEYAWMRGMELGADSAVVFELDVPDAALIKAQSWWWAQDQLQLPAGCPASCILSVVEIVDRPTEVGG